MKNVLVISSSLRKNSNSEQLAVSFAEGAKSAENEVEVISLRDTPYWLPSPNRRLKFGRSTGVEMMRISRMPASISVDRG